jgi:hypothetical protein
MVKNLFKNSPIYFIQPANISEFEVTAKPLMEKVVLE